MKKVLILLAISLFSNINSFILHAQKQEQAGIDSLLKELPKAKEDKNKAYLLGKLALEYYNINSDLCLDYGNQAIKLFEKLDMKKELATAYYYLYVKYLSDRNFPQAFESILKSADYYEKIGDKKNLTESYRNISGIFSELDDSIKALEYLLKALKIDEEIDNEEGILNDYWSLGYHYLENDSRKALDYLLKSLELKITKDSKRSILQIVANNLNGIGHAYRNLKEYSKAIEYYQRARVLYRKIENFWCAALTYSEIGNVYFQKSYYSTAIDYQFKALKFAENENNSGYVPDAYLAIGIFYLEISRDSLFKKIINFGHYIKNTREENLNKAIFYFEKILEIFKTNPKAIYYDIKDLYSGLYQAYKEKGNFEISLKYYEMYHNVLDSIFGTSRIRMISKLEIRNELTAKDKETQFFKNKQALQEAKLTTRNYQLYGALLLLILIFIILYVVITQSRKSEKLLLNILPEIIAKRLKKKEHPIADHLETASIIFIDVVDFTVASANTEPKRIVEMLNNLYSKLDMISMKLGLEKIKTIGDCYMAASGLPIADKDNVIKAATFAIEAMTLIKDYKFGEGIILNFRCGIDCGPVVAGVIGEHKFIYDVWGDTVNTAARMEEYSEPGRIQVTERFKESIANYESKISNAGTQLAVSFGFEERGEIEIKGKGVMRTWFLVRSNI
ncbi:MAG: adenylate cyclase [Bacteroidota bacterium]|nr:adenylate cyclase [Bacteroidota bacterium]